VAHHRDQFAAATVVAAVFSRSLAKAECIPKKFNDIAVLLRLAEQPMCLRPVPQRLELRWRPVAFREALPMLSQHFPERHSVRSDAVRIRAAFEKMQCICVCIAMIESHFCAIQQQGIASGVGFALRHRRIDVGTVIQQQVEPRALIIRNQQ
jgi:hypothetical protein